MKKAAKENIEPNSYTVTEVGTMLEEINKGVKIIAEGPTGLAQKMERLEVEVHGNSRRLDMLEISNSIVKGKISHLEDGVSKLNKDVSEIRQELKETRQELKDTRADLKKDIHDLGNRLTSFETRG